MNPTYDVRAAPQHPASHYAFSAISIQPARAEPFEIAHIVLVAAAVQQADLVMAQQDNLAAPIASSQHAVALCCAFMQQEIALPVVRRLVEALRQTNLVLYRENQRVQIVVGLLIKDRLYLACVGNVSAYVIRGDKVVPLLCAPHTRDRYLGYAAQLLLDYQLKELPTAFVEQKLSHAYRPTAHFVLKPSDTLILCATELTVAQIQPAMIYTRRPDRLAVALAATTVRPPAGLASGVVALHWRVDRISQLVARLGLVPLIFLCVTVALHLIMQMNQHLDPQLAVYAETGPVRQSPPFVPAATSAQAPATVQAHTLVMVHVNVRMAAALTLVPTATSGVVTAMAGQLLPTQSVVDQAWLPTGTSLPTLPPTWIPTAASAGVESTAVPIVTVVPALPSASVPMDATVTLLDPPEQTSSEDRMTFAWQSDLALLPGQAYEVIIWRNEQTPLRDGLGIAAPTQAQSLTVQFKGLQAAGVMQPGVYQWGILLVTVEPYARLALLSGGRSVTFADDSHSSTACDPDRATC